MAISYSSGIGRTKNSSVGIDRLRIDFDSNLRRWFTRNIGLWHSRRQYFFDEEKAINLEMYINVSKLTQSNLEFESYQKRKKSLKRQVHYIYLNQEYFLKQNQLFF